MIKYTLKCQDDHQFDGWFQNSAAFDEQKRAGFLTCPYCGTAEVNKTLMAPRVTGTKAQGDHSIEREFEHSADTAQSAGHNEVLPTTIPEPLIHGDDTMRAVVEKMRELRTWVEKNAENVGDQFAEKAREIHYGDEENRGIYGKATFDEAQELIDEGVDFLPLPGLPEDNN